MAFALLQKVLMLEDLLLISGSGNQGTKMQAKGDFSMTEK